MYSFLDLASDVLKEASSPLTYQEIWDIGKEKGLTDKIKTSGKHHGKASVRSFMLKYVTTKTLDS